MQNDMDEMQLEMRRKDNSLNVTLTERERAEQLLRAKEDNQQHEKLVMREEIITLKKAKDRLELEGARKNSQLLEAKTEVDKSSTALRNAEFKLNTLKSQLDQRTETLQMTQIALEEKRAALMATESQLRDTEDRLYTNTIEVQDTASQEIRVGLYENAILTRENSNFSRRLTEYQRLLDKEKDIRENIDIQQRENISELITLRDREKQLDLQMTQTQSEIQREKERCQNYLEQLTKQENLSRTMESELSSTKLRLAEIESMHQVSETENGQLRKDKILLVDHVAELQRKIETKDHELISLQSEISSLESRLHDLDYQKNLESTVHSQKWQEFGRLAESMRTLSSTMARSTSPTHSTSKLLQY
ncbi:hypothetical protein LOTGIDRAFT_129830 [Lottia gigantea]|uniref:Uncharacterized protein n=1 Tax=Lottia gigantea TaxID=225164 RepID=V3ZP36_LOTGI|nr:hypothetical protein LOTGIDRAFT_129830 [Lottia gigantea]ESO86092.1 hypothetical protein LOTGIDRAFT_129830 [Lottia gigantea]